MLRRGLGGFEVHHNFTRLVHVVVIVGVRTISLIPKHFPSHVLEKRFSLRDKLLDIIGTAGDGNIFATGFDVELS